MSTFQSEYDFLDDMLMEHLDTTPILPTEDESVVENSPLTHLIDDYCRGILSANSQVSMRGDTDLDRNEKYSVSVSPEHDSQAALWIDDICDVV